MQVYSDNVIISSSEGNEEGSQVSVDDEGNEQGEEKDTGDSDSMPFLRGND